MALALGLFVVFTILDIGILIIAMMIVYTFFFNIGIGLVLFFYLAEILPAKALSIAVFVKWVAVIAVTFGTPLLMAISKAGTFGFFGICCFLFGIFAIFFLKETKGKTSEQVAQLYSLDKREVKQDPDMDKASSEAKL